MFRMSLLVKLIYAMITYHLFFPRFVYVNSIQFDAYNRGNLVFQQAFTLDHGVYMPYIII